MPLRKDDGIAKKSIELEDFKPIEKPQGKWAELQQRLQDSRALMFNTLQDAKEVKLKKGFTEFDSLRRDLFERAAQCKAVASELTDVLASLGDEDRELLPSKKPKAPEEKQESPYEHRRYLKK